MDNSILRNCGITAMSIDITYNCNFRVDIVLTEVGNIVLEREN